MYSKEELSSVIENYIKSLSFPTEPSTLYAPIAYSLESGGKRVRPLLTMMACNIFSDKVDHALPCATAIEVFHNFTLLHDDIMDNASVRRGRPAVHRKWGENTAILSGDAMMIYSYQLLEKTDNKILPRIFGIFNDTSLKVCEGQQYDMDYESLSNVSLDEYIKMISLKTGILMAGATVIGAVAGGASDKDCDLLYTFAMELGIAFQIRDDILDSYGTLETLGKNIGGDITEGKKTFLTTLAMTKADDTTRTRLSGLMQDKSMEASEKIKEVLAVYDSLGVRDEAEKAVEHHTALAVSALEAVSVKPERIAPMKQLATELTKRIS